MRQILSAGIGIALFFLGHAYANRFRGEDAYGGELVFLLAIPLVWALQAEKHEKKQKN